MFLADFEAERKGVRARDGALSTGEDRHSAKTRRAEE